MLRRAAQHCPRTLGDKALPGAALRTAAGGATRRAAGGPLVKDAARGLPDGGQLKHRLAQLIPKRREEIKALRAAHGSAVLSPVTVDAAYGGMRGVKGLLYETSLLDPEEGIRFRGLSIPECQERLTRASETGAHEPLPEALFYLLLTGEVPTEAQTREISADWLHRATERPLPRAVLAMIRDAAALHPMSQLGIALNALQGRSVFAVQYEAGGLTKDNMWEYALEDVCEVVAQLPAVAAAIYANVRRAKAARKASADAGDWAGRFAGMLGFSDARVRELMRLYMTIHADHEGGNVSAHAVHLVGSALADPFRAYAAGTNGLAGPLHGLANQECLAWLLRMRERVRDSPSDEDVAKYIWDTLNAGQVVPGYGHAVLRRTDPRFACQAAFAARHVPDDPLVKLCGQVFRVAPGVLREHGKTRNPWPNVDAHSGVLLHHFGLVEMRFYTVLFAVSRAIGALSGLLWDRALALPIERPKSLTTEAIRAICARAGGPAP